MIVEAAGVVQCECAVGVTAGMSAVLSQSGWAGDQSPPCIPAQSQKCQLSKSASQSVEPATINGCAHENLKYAFPVSDLWVSPPDPSGCVDY